MALPVRERVDWEAERVGEGRGLGVAVRVREGGPERVAEAVVDREEVRDGAEGDRLRVVGLREPESEREPDGLWEALGLRLGLGVYVVTVGEAGDGGRVRVGVKVAVARSDRDRVPDVEAVAVVGVRDWEAVCVPERDGVEGVRDAVRVAVRPAVRRRDALRVGDDSVADGLGEVVGAPLRVAEGGERVGLAVWDGVVVAVAVAEGSAVAVAVMLRVRVPEGLPVEHVTLPEGLRAEALPVAGPEADGEAVADADRLRVAEGVADAVAVGVRDGSGVGLRVPESVGVDVGVGEGVQEVTDMDRDVVRRPLEVGVRDGVGVAEDVTLPVRVGGRLWEKERERDTAAVAEGGDGVGVPRAVQEGDQDADGDADTVPGLPEDDAERDPDRDWDPLAVRSALGLRVAVPDLGEGDVVLEPVVGDAVRLRESDDVREPVADAVEVALREGPGVRVGDGGDGVGDGVGLRLRLRERLPEPLQLVVREPVHVDAVRLPVQVRLAVRVAGRDGEGLADGVAERGLAVQLVPVTDRGVPVGVGVRTRVAVSVWETVGEDEGAFEEVAEEPVVVRLGRDTLGVADSERDAVSVGGGVRRGVGVSVRDAGDGLRVAVGSALRDAVEAVAVEDRDGVGDGVRASVAVGVGVLWPGADAEAEQDTDGVRGREADGVAVAEGEAPRVSVVGVGVGERETEAARDMVTVGVAGGVADGGEGLAVAVRLREVAVRVVDTDGVADRVPVALQVMVAVRVGDHDRVEPLRVPRLWVPLADRVPEFDAVGDREGDCVRVRVRDRVGPVRLRVAVAVRERVITSEGGLGERVADAELREHVAVEAETDRDRV